MLTFLDRSELRLSYLRPQYAVSSTGPFGAFQFVAITFHGNKDKKYVNFKGEIEQVIERTVGRSSATRKLVKGICDRVTLHKFNEFTDGEDVITKLAQFDIQDSTFLESAARTILEHLIPEVHLPKKFRFKLIELSNGHLIDTDLDFSKLNSAYHKRVSPKHSTLTADYILSHILTARVDSFFAAEYLAEIVTAPLNSKIMRIKHYDILRAREKSIAKLDTFVDLIVSDVPSIRETINSGERSLSDFFKLLDQAQQFRGWLQNTNPDSELISNYLKAATQATWADKVPTKTVRWAIATGFGVAADLAVPTGLGTVAGVGIGALDAFFLDRYIKGWRPNHFIDGPYKEFLRVGDGSDA